MKNAEVVITPNTITLKDNPRSVVMDSASESLTEFYAHVVCQNGGKVLDVGFGMGFSAKHMYKLSESYTCIEINSSIYSKAKDWAKDKQNVQLYLGDWFDIVPILIEKGIKFDGIFMDTHLDTNYEVFEESVKKIANQGCILSIFNYFTQRDTSKMNEYIFKLDPRNYSVIVKDHHKVNWTVFDGNDFVKTDNKIKFPSPNVLI